MRDSIENRLPPALERAASLLRDEPPVRDAWRAALLARVAAGDPLSDKPPAPRWTLSPFAAIAAGILCAVAGAGLTLAVARTKASLAADHAIAATPPAGTSRVRFALVAPNAAHVSIVGDFNRWNPAALPLRRLPDGRTWEVEVPLAPGRYIYAFFVDGRVARDTAAAESANDGFGVTNSVILVKGT